MRKGKKVIVPGDGTSLWALTHHRDFAKGFIGLLANPHAIGEAYHITSDEILTWNQIYTQLAAAAGVEAKLFHVASESLARHFASYNPRWAEGLLGDRQHSLLFDNTKIKRAVPGFVATIPFAQGAKEMVDWYAADPARQTVDPVVDALFDKIIAAYEAVLP
jgi:nucleoside-diphosphate-sugar epimerase